MDRARARMRRPAVTPSGTARRTSRGPRWGAHTAAVASLAVLVRAWHLAEYSGLPWFRVFQMDPRYHVEWARRLVEQGWRDPEPFFRAPGYPYLLGVLYGLFGELVWAPRVIQAGLGAATAVLVHRIALRFLAPRWALAAGLLAAVLWTPVHFETELLLEPGLTFVTTLLLYLMVRVEDRPVRRAWVVAWGALGGLAAILRPNVLLFLPVVPLYAAWLWARAAAPPSAGRPHAPSDTPIEGGRPRRVLRALPTAVLLAVAGFAVPVLPVWIHNARHGDPATVLAWQGGINFYIGNNPQSNGWTAVAPGMRSDWRGGYEDAIRGAQARSGVERPLRPSEVSAFWMGEGLRFWREQPGDAARLLARKALLFWSNREIKNNEDPRFFRERLWSLRWSPVSFGALAPLALLGLPLLWRRGPGGRLLVLFVAAWFVSIVPFFVCARYRLPVTPLLPIFGLAALAHGWGWARSRRLGQAAAGAVAAAGLYGLLFTYGADTASGGFFQSWCNYADAQAELRRWDEAIEGYRRSLELNPRYANAWNNLGLALEARGRLPEAEDAYRRGIEAVPEHPMLRKNLAMVRRAQGAPDEAVAVLEPLVAEYPRAWDLWGLLAQFREEAGRIDAAETAYAEALRLQPGAAPLRARYARMLAVAGDTAAARAILAGPAGSGPASTVRRSPQLPVRSGADEN